jgi:hypothetical protein
MKILKTSALAAVLALGSFAANADYSGSTTVNLRLNMADAITVSFTNSIASFDDVIAGDTLGGSVPFTITAASAAAIACTITDDSNTTTAITVSSGPTISIVDSAGSGTTLGSVDLTVSACDDGSQTLNFVGSANSGIAPSLSGSHTITLGVDYSANTTVTAYGTNT